MNIVVRVYVRDVLQSATRIDLPEDYSGFAERIAANHAEVLMDNPGYVEIEFLDEPDFNQRFFRFGNDASGMRDPVAFDPESEDGFNDALSRWGKG